MTKLPWPPNHDAILQAVKEVFEDETWWVYKGERVRAFEEQFAAFHGCPYGVSACNGTVVLEVVLRALGIAPGDRIILPAFNFYSLPRSVSNTGATPVFVDVCPQNLTIDASQVQTYLEAGARAVVAVHISGSVAQLDVLRAMCDETGAYLIEDCAQAAGARYGGRPVGSWGDAGLFSFGGVKLMTCGQGGMITTRDTTLYERCYALVNRGFGPDGQLNRHGLVGDNYQLSELAATTLGPQLAILEDLCARREATMRFLDEALMAIPGFTPFEQFPQTTCRAQMRYDFFYDTASHSLDALIEAARQAGIPLRRSYRAVPTDSWLFNSYAQQQSFPVAARAQDTVVSIPHVALLQDRSYWGKAMDTLHHLIR